jgi:hypothetical protein
VGIDLGRSQHGVHPLLEQLVDHRLERRGARVEVLQIEPHDPVQEELQQAVAAHDPEGAVKAVGREIGAAVGLEPHQAEQVLIDRGRAGAGWPELPSRHVRGHL